MSHGLAAIPPLILEFPSGGAYLNGELHHMRALFLALAILVTGTPAFGQPSPVVRPGFDGIFEAFRTHPLVGLGETHRRAQEIDFYTALIRDPRFAREVGNVVVEFGGAAHQDIIDRYVAGEDVPYLDLRKVWTDTVGWIGVVPSMGYQLFYYQLRQVNLTLPPSNRIHVWLGEPVIDWSQIKTHADWVKVNRLRDSHAAELIEREILGRGRKALVIYGGGHFWPLMPGDLGKKLEDADWGTNTLRARIDQAHPGALFTARFYTGAGDKACVEDFESRVSSAWPVPALVTPLHDSAVADNLLRCNPVPPKGITFPPGLSDAQKQQAATFWAQAETRFDALIYVGPKAQLAFAPTLSDYFMDGDYFQEIARHYFLQTGEKLDPPNRANYPMTPRFPNR
jgi:hypothetical protein